MADISIVCTLCDKPETRGNLCRVPKGASYGDQYRLVRHLFSRVSCSPHAADHRECRQQLRHLFHTEEQLGLLEREKRAHCYPVALLDRVFLSNPALPCHKTCLGGIRVLIRLWNGVAAAEVTYPTLRPVSSDSVPSARPETGSSTEFESSDVISDLGIPAPSAGHRHMTRNSSIRQSHRDSPSRSLLRGPRLDPLALPTLSTDKSNLKRSSSLASLGSLGDFHLPSLSTNVSPQQPVSPPPGDLFPTHTFTGAHTRNLLAIKKQRQQAAALEDVLGSLSLTMTGGKLLSTAEPFDIPALPPHAPVLTSKRSLVGAVIEAAQAGLLPSHPQHEEVAPKSPPQQLFLQSFLQSNIWPGMAGDRVKEIRRALHKSFKIKDYESLVACPPLPAALFEAARSFLAGAGMAPLSSMEQEPYNRFYTLHTTATGSDEDMEDSFVSDLSSAMNSARVSVVGVDGSDWDFPFGVHSTVEAAVAMHNVIEPPRPVSGDYDAMDLSFLPSPAFNNVSPSAALSGLALTL